jgi:hypothetical protein
MKLSVKQTEALDYLEDSSTTEVLLGGGAGGGKSILGAYWLQKSALRYPGSRWLMGRAILKTLRETTLQTFFKVAKLQGVSHTFKYIAPSSIRFKNGSEILLKDLYAYPGDPDFDELGSLEITGLFIDEANQVSVKGKNIAKSRIRHMLDEYNLIPKALYTCNPAKNWVKAEFRDPWQKGTLISKRKFVPSLVHDNPFISKHYAENLRDLDKASRERLLDGNWDYNADPSSLMNQEAIQSIFYNKYVLPIGKKYITADIARQGSDKIVIRVWHGWRAIERQVYAKQAITVTADKINALAQKHRIPMHQVLVDEDGVGGGVVDILSCKGFIANSSPIDVPGKKQNYKNLKAQCAWHLAEQVNNGNVYENLDGQAREDLQEELEQIKRKGMDKDGPLDLVSKEVIKLAIGRSPDDSDTYLMRSWFDVAVVTGPTIVTPDKPGFRSNRTI